MKMKGELFWSVGTDQNSTIKDAVVTSKRISIDWVEGDSEWHLDATSRDGQHFSGNYGYSQKGPDFEFDLTLYRNKSEYLLLGTWCQHDTGDEGTWFFKLTPEAGKQIASRSKRAKS